MGAFTYKIITIKICAGSGEKLGRLMSDLAHTPIVIDGSEFGSAEAFFTWLVADKANAEKPERMRATWGLR